MNKDGVEKIREERRRVKGKRVWGEIEQAEQLVFDFVRPLSGEQSGEVLRIEAVARAPGDFRSLLYSGSRPDSVRVTDKN